MLARTGGIPIEKGLLVAGRPRESAKQGDRLFQGPSVGACHAPKDGAGVEGAQEVESQICDSVMVLYRC